MDKDKTLKDLQERYPEDLNEQYNCYWWMTSNTDGSSLTYFLILRDKFGAIEEEGKVTHDVCLRVHNPDPEKLVTILNMYLETCKF